MKRHIVTGGAGFIGSTLVRTLLNQADGEVEVIDNLLTGYEHNLEEVRGRVKFHRLDIRDGASLEPVIRGAIRCSIWRRFRRYRARLTIPCPRTKSISTAPLTYFARRLRAACGVWCTRR